VSDARDLIEKTDALLGRYRGNSRFGPESDFPVLTDIYPQGPISGSPAENSVVRKTGSDDKQAEQSTESPDFREDQLVAEVLRQLASHIDEVLGDPLRERIEEHLRNTLTTLTGQVQIDIENLVRVAVSQAVNRVISKN